MGLHYSRQLVYLQDYQSCVTKERSAVFMLHNSGDIPRSDKKTVILGVDVLFIYNPTDQLGDIVIHGLPLDPLYVPIAPHINLAVEEVDRILYRPPKLKASEIRKYAGMEESILADPQEVYRVSDPIVQFILDHKQHFTQQISYTADEEHVLINADLLEQVQTFFRHAIFDEIRYTVLKDLTIDNPTGAHVVIRIDYLEVLEDTKVPLKYKSILL
jgi:hypothetical protein